MKASKAEICWWQHFRLHCNPLCFKYLQTYVNVIKPLGFKANIASQSVIPVIKLLSYVWEKSHVSTISENINKYSRGSAGVVIPQFQREKKLNMWCLAGLKRHIFQPRSIPFIFHWVPNQRDRANYLRWVIILSEAMKTHTHCMSPISLAKETWHITTTCTEKYINATRLKCRLVHVICSFIAAAVAIGRCLLCTLVMIDWSGLYETTSDFLLTRSHWNSTDSAAYRQQHAKDLNSLPDILAC